MDWIIFGDDWGRHPSTTQHLVSRFQENDRILWIDSIGMRSPKLSVTDGARAIRKTSANRPATIPTWRPEMANR